MATEYYQWESFQGCSRCQALAGLYAGEPPARPHPMCRCDVVRLQGDDIEVVPWDRVVECYWISIEDLKIGRDSPARPGNSFSLIYEYNAKCIDGSEHAGEVEVEQSWDDWEDFDGDESNDTRAFMHGYNLALLEAFEEIGRELEAVCDCSGGPVS